MRKLGMALALGILVGCNAPQAARAPEAARAPAAASGAEAESAPAESRAADEAAPASAPGGGATGAAAPAQATITAESSAVRVSAAPPPAPAPAGGATRAAAKSSAKPAADSADTAAVAVAPGRPAPPPRESRPLPQAGQLTAGIWDDNRNFDFYKPYAARFADAHGADFAMFTTRELEAARAEASQRQGTRSELDVQLVLDTTGSMGDELSYLQSELDSIATQVKVRFPNVTPRWSLVVYRDHGDEYVARAFDFTTDLERFRANLRAQSAGGGGDTPEAVVEGLAAGLQQHWRPAANVAKIAFWVADAPAHPGQGGKLGAVIRDARNKGVHVYPVASSDADDAAEFQMRSAAQMTSGRYVFLTSDSGIGNAHAEPHIPCYNVSRLDHAIVRMVEVEMTGSYVEADARQVVRSVGRPDAQGKCRLSSGMLVASY